ncbi:arylesterase [Legionella taurinensis]|uniref:Arylesterase n=1 Tax=Legionella taurinensis TaxID=70611 RepID=A0A3A5LBG9_9GAMM|nr:arylesterase [Legionella taurinensis]MDX1836153.1 arylesterase [Legionella taurinensis]PUT42076.1 arylesterase [Legionella taurinensis]PUT44863.1 arylesterase [Legionella taurinensis]PUT48184.1 arylesterase [Legionella taurinensis]PUT48998.1 arylesterase [Legionella taurinensis]
MKPLHAGLVLFALIIAPLYAKNIVVLGDSLSAGYGIDVQKSWVVLLSEKLKQEHQSYRIINLSTSGDTTSNGLRKLKPALQKYQPEVIIIELGANDGLRGLPVRQMKDNLEKMVIASQKTGAKVIVLATLLPPNYGSRYLDQFNKAYAELAKTYGIILVPMFLEGVAGDSELMQKDGLHPNERAQQRILDNVWPHLKPVLK